MSTGSEPRQPVPSLGPGGSLGAEDQPVFVHKTALRVRYSETDQMGTFYNSRALEWFECGRTELLRAMGMPYSEMEARGLFLPLVEAHLEFQGRARYDDLLELTTVLRVAGRARMRLDVQIVQAGSGRAVVRGYTVHAFADQQARAVKPPPWFLEIIRTCSGPSISAKPGTG